MEQAFYISALISTLLGAGVLTWYWWVVSDDNVEQLVKYMSANRETFWRWNRHLSDKDKDLLDDYLDNAPIEELMNGARKKLHKEAKPYLLGALATMIIPFSCLAYMWLA